MRRCPQAHGVEFLEHARLQLVLGNAGVFAERKSNVLEHVQIREQGALLEQHAHALPQLPERLG